MRGVIHPSFNEPQPRNCKDCNKLFYASPNRDYCDNCRELICQRCGSKFIPKQRNHKQKYCTVSCGARTGRTKRTVTIPKARAAQRLVAYYIEKGKLVRPNICEECGQKKKIEAAHYNYDNPLKIRWLCRSCHVKWDKHEPKGATYAKFIGKEEEWEAITPCIA